MIWLVYAFVEATPISEWGQGLTIMRCITWAAVEVDAAVGLSGDRTTNGVRDAQTESSEFLDVF